MTAGKRFRVAVVGTGGIAASHLNAYRAHADEVEVVAAADLDEGRLADFRAEAGGIPGYRDLAEMLADQRPDLVSICTPPGLHVEQARAVLGSGAWAWCEKPPCLSLAGYDEIVAAESPGGPYAAFVFQQRFGSGAGHLRRLLAAGELGRPLVAHCQTTWFRDAEYYAVPWRGKWATEGGGPAMGHGIHQMDLLLHLLGDWAEVRAMAGRLVHDVETEDVSTALVRFASGALATVVNSVLSPHEVSRIRLDCADATVELTHLYGYRNDDFVYTPAPHVEDEPRVRAWREPATDEKSSHAAQLTNLLADLRTGTRPECGGADGRRVLEFIAALYKSAFTGLPVLAGEITRDDPFYARMHGGLKEGIVP
ncbi:Gfo/Idh/MocA family protein [Amycolatopsis anabasis]|uniref:Gfo/Idh/MocA family protein n=1 Tax=Amycolatopsis anabasis TaxID=1840409 RepID=UPI001FE37AAE|nr:Gfo/Idh/MocA family oxidoreductase [Amycolatopsis anabasis]